MTNKLRIMLALTFIFLTQNGYCVNKHFETTNVITMRFLLKLHRSSHWRCSIEKGVFKNLTKFTGKHLCQSLFLIKLHTLACNFIKKRDSGTCVFLWILLIFLEHLFYGTPPGDCFMSHLYLFCILLFLWSLCKWT